MKGKVLIVEDEPIVALDLQQELEQLGCEVVGLAESADEALVAAELIRPDLALMDIRIVGSMDGIQAARLLRSVYHVPVVFLTSYSDETTVGRHLKAMGYRKLTARPRHYAQNEFALEIGISPQMLSETYKGTRNPGPPVMKYLGIEKAVVYKLVDGGKL